ncbi:MAG: hypothetical protein JWO38_6914 [Gemmataceae bacterium]|nr:hypothetical protein [Gemmataceae bacterium]
MNWLTRRRPATLYASLVVGFLIFRAVLFAVTTAGEYRLYRDYGEAARATSLDELYRTREIEYPHLAVAFGSAACVLADVLPGWTARLVRWRPNKFEPLYLYETPAEHDEGDRYEVAFGLILFAVDVGCLGLVYLIARRVYPAEGHVARVGRMAGYVVATGALGLILYDRQDLVVGLVALLALWALAAGRPAVGYAVLTLGTAYKLVPVLLIPVWVMAAAAVRAGPNATRGRYLRAVLLEAAVAGLILAAWPVLTYWLGGGPRAFLFLTFHSARGLQLEAPVAWPVLLIDLATEVGHGYGSYNLRGELADRVAKPTRLLMPLSVLAGVFLAGRGFRRAASAPARPSFPELVPHTVAAALLIWLGFITTNKVGSPQYLIWIAPLVPLLPLRTWAERGWAGAALIAMLCTSAVFPCAYPAVVGPVVRTDPSTWAGPTAGGLFLLAAKSVTLVITTGWLAVSVWRAPRVGAPGRPPPSPVPELPA